MKAPYILAPLSGGRQAILIPDDATGLSTDDFCRAALSGSPGDVIIPIRDSGETAPVVPGYVLFALIGPPTR